VNGERPRVSRSRYADEMMPIHLNHAGIDEALPRVSTGLRKYEWLQAELYRRDVSRDREYQTRFNGFYRVRRNTKWQHAFYRILEQGKSNQPCLSGSCQ